MESLSQGVMDGDLGQLYPHCGTCPRLALSQDIFKLGRANTCEYVLREIDMGTQSGWQQWVSASVRLSETPRGSTSRIAAPIGPSPSRSARRRGSPQKRSWSILGCKSQRSSGRPMPWWPPSSGTGRGWRGGHPDKRSRVGEPVFLLLEDSNMLRRTKYSKTVDTQLFVI